MSINRVNISGNLTRDPELRSTASGMLVLSFGVAVNDRYRNQQTEQWEDRPNFVDCTVFGKRAEALGGILHKGMKVAIEGKLRWSQWESDDGTKRSKIEIVVDEVEFMQQPYQQPYQQPQPAQQQPYSQPKQKRQAPQQPAQAYQAPQPQQTYQAAHQPYQAPQQAAPQAAPQPPAPSLYDEDIPF